MPSRGAAPIIFICCGCSALNDNWLENTFCPLLPSAGEGRGERDVVNGRCLTTPHPVPCGGGLGPAQPCHHALWLPPPLRGRIEVGGIRMFLQFIHNFLFY